MEFCANSEKRGKAIGIRALAGAVVLAVALGLCSCGAAPEVSAMKKAEKFVGEGDYAGAYEQYNLAIGANADLIEAYKGIMELYHMGECSFEQVLPAYEKLKETDNETPRDVQAVIDHYMEVGDYVQCETELILLSNIFESTEMEKDLTNIKLYQQGVFDTIKIICETADGESDEAAEFFTTNDFSALFPAAPGQNVYKYINDSGNKYMVAAITYENGERFIDCAQLGGSGARISRHSTDAGLSYRFIGDRNGDLLSGLVETTVYYGEVAVGFSKCDIVDNLVDGDIYTDLLMKGVDTHTYFVGHFVKGVSDFGTSAGTEGQIILAIDETTGNKTVATEAQSADGLMGLDDFLLWPMDFVDYEFFDAA